MFTGIIEETGIIVALDDEGITLGGVRILADVALGDSISVDGICLTVVGFDSGTFRAGLSAETVRRTTLRHRVPGDRVNLESALRAGGKIGGHFVSGHIDGVGHCLGIHKSGAAWEMDFEAPEAVSRYIVEKGSIAINGISLTVAGCSAAGDQFRVAIIPHSFDGTTLTDLHIADAVNLEADLLGKYVEKLLKVHSSSQPDEDLSLAFLAEHGYA